MPIIQFPEGRMSLSGLIRVVWQAVRVVVGIAIVVVPFGYAITGEHNHLLMGAGCGLAIGVGLSLRMGERNGLSVGILVGSVLGMVMVLIAGAQDFAYGPGIYIPPVLGLGVGLIDGLGTTRFQTYREASLESLMMCVLLAFGMLPALGLIGFIVPLALMPTMALIAGFFSRNLDGRRYSRPPVLLIIGTFALYAALIIADHWFNDAGPPLYGIVLLVLVSLLGIPTIFFLSGRAIAVWIQPRLRVYVQLADYLRVMWVPIGGFAVGYLTIIILFAGFYGTLERFIPGSFTGGSDTGIADWVAFSFFRALTRDYTAIVPVSPAAWALVGAQMILSVGWALVVFAAVMSSIQPQLERIARRNSERDGD